MNSLDWLLAIGLTLFVLCALAGMVKFVQALGVLRRGRPEIDQELLLEQEQEFQNDEKDN
ncbi:hypothetical protein V2O64_12810 [Verrucomicrobiaceae bacterium 227]